MKRKLLLTMLFVVGALGFHANAQTWTASEVGAGDFYLYNVEANKYLSNGNSWGTHAALSTEGFIVNLAKVNDNVYTIGTNSKYVGRFFTDNGYVDTSSATEWTFEPVAGETNTYKIKTAGGNYIYATAGLCNVGVGNDTGDKKSYWKLVTEANRAGATIDFSSATATNPIDVTSLIKNPCFDTGVANWEGTLPTRGGNGGSNGNVDSWNDYNPCAEHFNKTYDTNQTISGLANGFYGVRMQGFYRDGGYAAAATARDNGTEDLNAILYANGKEVKIKSILEDAGRATGGNLVNSGSFTGIPNNMSAASYFFSAGLYENVAFVEVTDGTLKIGVKKTVAVDDDWTIFDNFRLEYYGTETSVTALENAALIVQFDAAKAAAESINQAAPMNATVLANLKDAITEHASLETSSATADQLTAAISALNDNAILAETSVAAYASAKSALDLIKATINGTNVYTSDAYTTYNESYEAYQTKYDKATLTVEEAAKIYKSVLPVYRIVGEGTWHWDNETDDFLLSAWTIDGVQCKNYDKGLYINTWSTEGDNDGSNFQTPFFEYWTGDANSLAKKTLSGSVALENGSYTVSAWVRVRAKNGTAPADATGITMDVNGGTAVDVTEGTQVGTSQLQLKTYEATGFVNDGKLKVNFNILDGNNISWLAFKNVKYTFNGKCIGGEAQPLPEGNVEAGKWYYFDIPAAGDDATYRVSAPTISDVVYTQDGLVLISNETSVTETFPATGGAAFSDGLKLTAGRYYVKSATAQEISCVRTYAVEVDPNIELGAFNLDNAYEPAGATVTINVEPESEDYQMTKLKVYETANEESVVDVNINQGKYTFVMPAAAVTVTGEFSEVYDPIGYTINYYTEEDPFTPVKSVKGENFIKQVVEAEALFIDEESGKKYVLADETLNDFTSMTLQKEEKANILNVFVVEVPTYNYSVTTDNGIVVAEGTKFEDEVAPVAWFRYVQDEEGNWFEIKSDTYTAELTAEDKDLVLETEESDITAFYEAESLTPSEGVSTIDGEEYSGAAAIQLGVGASVATAEKIAGGYTDINVYAVSTAADAAPKYSIAYSADGEEWQETEVITFDAAAEGEPQVATVERLYLPEDCYIRLTEASEGEAQNNIDYITFTAVPMYEIAVDEAIENGTVTVSPDLAAEGDVVTLKATPAEGYALESYSVTGVNSNIAVEVENGKFTMPADAVTVSATFIVNETKQTTKPVPAFSELADDGETVQYLYNVESGAFLLGANDWGTRASLDEAKGYQFKVKKNDDGTTWTLNDYVENQSAWKAVFADNTSGIWVDNLSGANVAAWEIKVLGDNTYEITNPAAVADGKLAVSPALNDSRLYLVDDSRFGSTWAFVSEADYAQYLIDYAAWLEYVPELKQSTEAGTDITPAIGRIATSMDGWTIDNGSTFHINTWSWEGLTDGSWMTPSFLENWVAAGSLLPEGTWTYTISGLVPGQAYEVSALVRAYNEGSTDIPTGAYLYAGEGKSEDIATGTTNVGTKASVYATLTATGFADEEGNLKIGIVEKDNNFNWIVARDFKVTVSDAIFVPSIELANYAVTTDGEIDEEGFVRATVTYDPTVVGEFTWPTVEFTAEVVDAAGEVVTTVLLNTYADPFDGAITDGAVIGDIPGLEPNTAYTINITKVEVTAFDMEETFDFYTVYEEEGVDAPLATVQFTTPMPTGVAGLDAAEDAVKADGKYLENGKVVIYRGGIKYSATGAVLNK